MQKKERGPAVVIFSKLEQNFNNGQLSASTRG